MRRRPVNAIEINTILPRSLPELPIGQEIHGTENGKKTPQGSF